ncbi:MAG: hypothetical protein VW268_01970 [Rhodospirillaceae bacterium]
MRFIVDFKQAENDKVEIFYRSVARVFEVIRMFMATFDQNDDCVPEIRAEDRAFETYTLLGAFKECVAQERQL